jgi:hypothetical protein
VKNFSVLLQIKRRKTVPLLWGRGEGGRPRHGELCLVTAVRGRSFEKEGSRRAGNLTQLELKGKMLLEKRL